MNTNQMSVVTANGWPMVGLQITLGIMMLGGAIASGLTQFIPGLIIVGLMFVGWLILWNGFLTLQPNQAAVLMLFGRYAGTADQPGLRWVNPFLTKNKISQRSRNLNMQTLKVNDQRGNPVEIAAVVVWKVRDTAQAVFDVQDFENFVAVQSEAALRHVASAYPYDSTEEHVLSLRGSMDEVSAALKTELQDRLHRAGVQVEDARLSHLAYAPEIAHAMLQRQQAEAVVAARTRIVDGAVGIVEMALEKLARNNLVKLDDERKAAMVNNLLVVLCGDKSVSPVVHAGTLYN